MFGIEILGGLGNMLFCVATGEFLSHKYSMDVVYPNAYTWFKALPTECAWTAHADEYKTIFKKFDWFKNQHGIVALNGYTRLPFNYVPVVPQYGMLYAGYFQSYKNFDRDLVKEWFLPADHVIKRIKAYDNLFTGTTCSLHVRRGNYLNLAYIYPGLGKDYYDKAIAHIKADRYLVFSNDIPWCKNNFIGDQYIFIEDTDYIEMFLMSKCDHNIIANSSFSYWGAMLGNSSNRKVVCPSLWFVENSLSSDICPSDWIKI